MAITHVDIEDRYFISADDKDDLIVNVTIGDGQTGAYHIFLDKKLKGSNKQVNLKAAGKLIGQRCLVSAVVPDALDETNWTSLTVDLVKGNKQQRYGPYSKEVTTNLDTVAYTVSIYFETLKP